MRVKEKLRPIQQVHAELENELAQLEAEQKRNFDLRIYLGLTTAVTVVVLGVALWFLLSGIITRNMIELSHRNAIAVAKGLRNRLVMEQVQLVSTYGVDWMEESPEAQEQMMQLIKGMMHTFSIEEIVIYDAEGCVLYGTEPEQLGICYPDNENLRTALKGEIVSSVDRVEPLENENDEGEEQHGQGDALEVYVPLDTAPGSLESMQGMRGISEADMMELEAMQARVFEIYLDIGPLRQALRQSNFAVIAVLVITMLIFMGAQFGFAKKAERVIRAQRAALRASNQELRELQSLKDDLTNMIVHDLKNPITSVMGYLKLVLRPKSREALSDVQVQMLENAHASSQRMLDMTMNLLDISRMEEGKLDLKREPVDLAVMISEIVQRFDLSIREGQRQVNVDIDPELPSVPADREILRRIITNLFSNALKHTESGGHIILRAIETETAMEGQEAIRVSIEDDGEGIPPAAIPHLFEKFSQVREKQLGSKTDTGLGLAFCKLAVESHGGDIGVESTVGEGSTFYFTLPLVKEHSI